ncbi:aquaporin-8-like isoform X1 [Poeciliopsis prolifica]|uniref:aquaporin-8-like isoform X1 n=1 Tax=Poeciliopsis prolifica TaxID=188132 RepID=UPI0024145019|nr:aquaporin-8-like isoform X1 [Poeciliopsis prolifica]
MEKLEMAAADSSLLDEAKRPMSRPLSRYERVFQPCLAEVLGTMFFVFIGCVSVIENAPAAGRLQPALVHGLAVAVLVAVMDRISGSHFNPPFTVAIWLCGGMELAMVAPYLVSQLVGGVLGAGMAKLMTSPERFSNASGAAFDLLRSESQLYRALFGEAAMTCLVTLVVLMVAVNSRTKTPFGPFLVGSTVMFNILAGSLHESQPSVRSGPDHQPLDLPLGLLGGAHYRRGAGRRSGQAHPGRSDVTNRLQVIICLFTVV